MEIDVHPSTRYLVVVEKEGVYHRLCEDEFYE
jgi:DNA topoisomerase VI subunit A